MNVQPAIDRLNSQLPLLARQQALPAELVSLHRAILYSLVRNGRAPNHAELSDLLNGSGLPAALHRLGSDDLVVLNQNRDAVLGAYPVTEEETSHRVTVGQHLIHAMCALDAVSVAPMFGLQTRIGSSCHVSGDPILIRQDGAQVMEAQPADLRIGVRWQQPTSCAAHSMCMEMVFLRDQATALQWQAGDTENISLFSLEDAIRFGAGFFKPLLPT